MDRLMLLVVVTSLAAVVLQLAAGLVTRTKQQLLALAAAPLFAMAATVLTLIQTGIIAMLYTLFCGFLIFNSMRLVQQRMHAEYLRQAARRTTLSLSFGLLAIFCFSYLAYLDLIQVSSNTIWLVSTSIVSICSLIALGTVMYRFASMRRWNNEKLLADKSLPSLTVAIPARNETEQMAATLKAILASDYPKLEVLVIDDCSQDKTAEVIRGFAQDGVRFIEGKPAPLDDHWLDRNYALDQLLQAAAGEHMLFMSVGVHLEPNTLRRLMSYTKAESLKMMSLLPGEAQSFWPAPLHSWWQLAIPREWFGRAAVSSSFWLANRHDLVKAGGFAGVSRHPSPERHFAAIFGKKHAYSYAAYGRQLGVSRVATLKERYQRAIRLRYPETHRRPERVLGWLLAICYITALPLAALWQASHINDMTLFFVALVAVVAGLTSYIITEFALQPRLVWVAWLIFYPSLIAEICVIFWSMVAYEYGTVSWRGRNVCLPVMHVVPHLPPMPK